MSRRTLLGCNRMAGVVMLGAALLMGGFAITKPADARELLFRTTPFGQVQLGFVLLSAYLLLSKPRVKSEPSTTPST